MRLQQEFDNPAPLSLATREWIASSVLPILALAERRISAPELDKLEALLAMLPDDPPERGPSAFRIQFWMTIAEATQNPFILEGIRWWANAMQMREQRTGIDSTGPIRVIPKATYRGLIQALRDGSGAPAFWSHVTRQLSD